MTTEPKFYAVDPLSAYPEPVGTDDKLELNLDAGAVYVHLNYKRAKLVGLQSLDFLISQLMRLRADVKAATQCDLPPAGWLCTRTKGHDGPCAAVMIGVVQPVEPITLAEAHRRFPDCGTRQCPECGSPECNGECMEIP